MKTTTEMQLVPITKLVSYVNNARTHSPEQINKLRSSLREFGFINPVIIDRDYGVIAGHGRILAAKEEGISEVPCVFADHLTEAQKKAYIIADNRMAMDAGWDEELLRVEIESLQAADFDPLLTGFDEKELSKLFDDGIEAEEDNFDVDAELQKPTFTKPGDIWTLGRHRLICGDSTKEETYTALMDGRKANLVITDPPYNVNYEGSAGKIKNDNMASEKFFDFLFDAFSNMEKVMADDASIYVFHADTEGLNFRKAFDAAGFYLSGCCIWKKQSLVLGRSPSRAVPLRLEEERQAPVVHWAQRVHHLGVRQAQEKRRPSYHEADPASGLSHSEQLYGKLRGARPLRRLRFYAHCL